MNKTIEQLEAQIIELQKQIEELKNPKSYKRWRAEKGGIYYSIGNDGIFHCNKDYYYDIDNFNYNMGNYYQTEDEIIKAIDLQLAIVRVNDRIRQLNEGWEHNNKGFRCFLYYNKNKYAYAIDYFDVDGYIRPYIIDYMKTREIAEQIINEMKDDLDLIFNIK